MTQKSVVNNQNFENQDKVIFVLMKTNFGDIKLDLFNKA